ncbi:MarR family winged helix-turn-helix transcriptional regulator [Bacillus horti]|uniref:DNA-binding MarR family transcriptional regulator n=1 Tax=Caldalkalibacillus horti TaxID=77523 RepID=A0ABT9VXG7_9BACI|nr:MarR family transcriptional regulator [Bacillus horti]MDQ0165686.1 DNA-binding MarR family transcriptional regulator [Bacillus horti]
MKKGRESIAKWISVLHRQFQVYLNRELKEYDIQSSEYIFLVNLYERDGVSQEKLSESLYIDKAATARAIQRLEKLEYVSRRRDEKDKRAYVVTLTEKGRDVQNVIKEKLGYWTKTLTCELTDAEHQEMLKNIKRMSLNALNETKGEL